MGLRKQPIEVVLSGGVDTKTNPTLVAAGKLAKLENYAHKGGAIQRRPGSRAIWSPKTGTADVVPGPDAMLGRLNDRLLLRDKFRLFPFNAKTGKLTPNGMLLDSGIPLPVPSLYARTERVQGASGPHRLAFANSASAAGLTAYAWASGSQMYANVRAEDGSVLSPAVLLGTGTADNGALSSAAWAVAFQDTVAVVYGTSGGYRMRIADPLTGRLADEVVVTTNFGWSFDVALNPDNTLSLLSFEGAALSSKTLTLFKVGRDGSLLLTTALTAALSYSRLQDYPTAVSVSIAASGNIFCFYRFVNTTPTPDLAEVHCIIRSQAHASVAADTVVFSGDIANIHLMRLGSAPNPADSSQVLLAMDWQEPNLDIAITRYGPISSAPGFTGFFDLVGCRVISKPFGVGGEGSYVVLQGGYDWRAVVTDGFDRSLQSTAFVVDLNGEIVGRLLEGEVNAPSQQGVGTAEVGYARPVNVSAFTNADGSPGARLTVLCAGAQSVSNNRAYLQEVELVRDTIQGWRLIPVQYGRSLYFPGAMPRQFDGANLHEVAFNFFPEGINVALNAVAFGMDIGDIGVAVVYEWTDAAGELHESAPSVPFRITTDAGNRQAHITIPTLRLTDKLSTPVQIAIYQTPTNSDLYYRVAAIDNDPTQLTLSYDFGMSDEALAQSRLPYLYTTGGVAENVAPPACHHLSVHQERLVLSTEKGVHFSNRRIDGFAPHFHETFRIDLTGVVATGTIDGRLVIFTREKVFFSAGDGPDELGGGGAFSPPQVISNKTGCIAPQSVVETPFGLMFQGKRGIYMVQRDLSVEYIGADVEKLVGTITSAIHISSREEVRFNQSAPAVSLVFNYGEGGQWSTITPRQIASAVEYGDGLAWVSGADEDVTSLYKSDFTCISEAGEAMEALFETPWLRVGNITGFQRVSRLAMRGTYWGQSLVTVSIAYDGREDEWLEIVRKQTIDLNLEPGDPIRLEAHLKKQKCESIKLRVVDDGGGGAPSRGVDWIALALELGVRPGIFKLSGIQNLGKPEGSAGS